MTDRVLDLAELRFAWKGGPVLLDIPALGLDRGERLFLRGPSGSGKSTLLGLVCGVLPPQAGRIAVLGRDLATLSGAGRDALRAAEMGVVFQMFNLLPYLSVLANVTLPCRFSAERRRRAVAAGGSPEAEARRLLQRLGLHDPRLAEAPVRALSVGQQQRVAMARALIGDPALIVADEPTSALDSDARDAFLDLLLGEVGRSGASLLFVSHDLGLAGHFDRTADIRALNRAAAPATGLPAGMPAAGETP